MKSKFEITKEKKEEMAGHIQAYFEQERGEDIGNLAALMFLDFFMDKLAPVFYNLGVEDSHAYLTEKLDDLFAIQKV